MNLSAIDLNLLLVLHTVLETQSVKRAAAELHVTAPAVSNSLARLRTLLGDDLLVRRGRSLVATPRAVDLAPQLQTALGTLRQALDDSFDPTVTRRRFALALSDAGEAWAAPDIAVAMTARMPHAGLQIVSLDTVAASDGLANGAVDVAIAPAPTFSLHPGLHVEALYEEEGVLLVHKKHRVTGRLSPAQFNAFRHVDTWLVAGRPGPGHRGVDEFFARHGLKRDIALIVPSFLMAAMVVASSDLVSAQPRRLAERFSTMLPLRVLSIPGPSLRFLQRLIWHERTHRDPGATMFRELVTRVMRRPWRAALPSVQ
jgi:DNA-binding transcriptional LysR family regulator